MPVIANVLQPLIDVAHAILRFFHDSAGFSWGASIIGLTFVVRLAILPLTYKSITSMRGIQRLKPEFDRVKEKYSDDRKRMNEEMMKFYQEHKVNPAGSCLPILLQFPFFISLFYLLRSDEFQNDIRGEESFLFIPNLAEPATGWILAVLVVVYVGTQLGASLVTAATMDRNQRLLILGLPFLFVFFILNFETGLLVYWITTNVWTIGQQLVVKKAFPPPEPIPVGPKGSLGVTNASEGQLGRLRRRRRAGSTGESGSGNDAKGVPSGTQADDKSLSRAPKPRTKSSKTGGARATGNGNSGSNGANGRSSGPPPASPRRRKKRSGRRR